MPSLTPIYDVVQQAEVQTGIPPDPAGVVEAAVKGCSDVAAEVSSGLSPRVTRDCGEPVPVVQLSPIKEDSLQDIGKDMSL